MVELELSFFMDSEVEQFNEPVVTSREDVVVLQGFDAFDVICVGICIGMHHFSGSHIEMSQHEVIAS